MKILVVGDWHSNLHEEALYQAFKKLGHDVDAFSWHQYFQVKSSIFSNLIYLYKRCQYKYIFGPIIKQLNNDLIQIVIKQQPEMVFIYRGTHILPSTLNQIKKIKTILVGYNNDDPFSPYYSAWLWRHFLKGISKYDLMLAYRKHNVLEFLNAGAKRVELLRSWFIPDQNYPVRLTEIDKEKYECDVVFIGHYEDDGRLDCLEQIVKQGFKLKIFGHGYGWNSVLKKSSLLSKLGPVNLVWREDYNRALCGAKVALCFLSKLNRDTYTRRCFEIPATKTTMLAEYSDDLASLFDDGKDVCFFRNADELIDKLKLLVKSDSLREVIGESGFSKVYSNHHDVVSRAQQVINWLN